MSGGHGGGGGNSSGSSKCLEFLHCNKCFIPLSVIPDDSPHRPFSLTSCSHIFCRICHEKSGARGNACCVCGKSSVRILSLRSPMPDYVKRLFCNYVDEWEVNQQLVDERRKYHANALKNIADSLSKLALELSSASSSSKGGESLKKTVETAKFQHGQWRCLSKGYEKVWNEFRKSREEMKKYQNEIQQLQSALRAAEEEKRKLMEGLKSTVAQQQMQQQQQQQQQMQQQQKRQSSRSTPPPFFDSSNPNGRSPFFRKSKANNQPSASADLLHDGGSAARRKNAFSFQTQNLNANNAQADRESARKRLETPKIFTGNGNVIDDLMTSPYFAGTKTTRRS